MLTRRRLRALRMRFDRWYMAHRWQLETVWCALSVVLP